jgi:hypothetical protein
MIDGRSYSEARGLSIFRTNHLSLYAVTYEENSGGGCDAGFGVFGMAILALGIALTARTGKPPRR